MAYMAGIAGRTQNSAGFLRLQIPGVNAKLIRREQWKFRLNKYETLTRRESASESPITRAIGEKGTAYA